MIEIRKLNVVELFSGSGVLSDEFKKAGHNTFTVDIRKRKGICMPDLRKNILQLKRSDIPFDKIDVLWLSPPCDVWSYAAGSFHWHKEGTPKTEKCKTHINILLKSLTLIEEFCPGYFFIENPRGRLRKYPALTKFLENYPGVCRELTYSSYGFPTIKPTNIFTNALNYVPRTLDAYGRGAKNKAIFDNLTKCQRQKVPGTLAKEIRLFCEKSSHRD